MSFLSKDDPPTPPNPTQLAGTQTATNVSTAIANAFLNNTSQVTPLGNLTYDVSGTNQFTDPATGSVYDIPRFTATQSLSPTQQNLQNQSQAAQTNLAGMANYQSGKLSNLLANDINLSDASQFGDINRLINQPGAGTEIGGGDYSADRARVEASLMSRLSPQLERERGNLEQRLADQGIRYGSQAYNAAMTDYNDRAAAQSVAVTQAGAAEQQQAFQQAAARAQFANSSLAQNLQQQQAIVSAQNQQRNQYLTEQYALRSQPLNEISALLSGSQVSRPSFMTTPTNTIPTTDFAGLQNQNFQQNLDIYKQQSAQQQALIGGVLGFGGNLAKGGFFSDRRMKEDVHRIGTVFAADDETKLPIYQYAYKDDPASLKHIGPMAQDVEKVAPDAVKTARSGPHRGMKYIKPERMMGAILKAA